MWSLFRLLMDVSLLKPIVRPITRLIVGSVAVPLFRWFIKRVLRFGTLDNELEKDLEQWFRGALILLLATQNMETVLFPWVEPVIHSRFTHSAPLDPSRPDMARDEFATGVALTTDSASTATIPSASMLEVSHNDYGWILLGFRVMLAIGVIQMMPDQELFALMHSRPPKHDFDRKQKWWPQIKTKSWPFLKGHICLHLNKSSPVFAILAAIAPGLPGWICYGMALIQYLIIGLVTTQDKALNALGLLDQQAEQRRREVIEDFELSGKTAIASVHSESLVPSPRAILKESKQSMASGYTLADIPQFADKSNSIDTRQQNSPSCT